MEVARIVGRLLGGVVVAVGLVALLGWALERRTLTQLGVGGSGSLKANTAVCFVFLGAAVALRGTDRQRLRTVVQAVLGLAAVPYFLLFEFFGPIFEVLGIPAVLGWWLLGDLSVVFLVGFLLIALLVGVVLSLAALTLEEHSFRRHRDGRDIARLVRFSVLENVGYRQLVSFWRFLAFFDLVRGHREWGEMPRRGFRTVPEAPLPPA